MFWTFSCSIPRDYAKAPAKRGLSFAGLGFTRVRLSKWNVWYAPDASTDHVQLLPLCSSCVVDRSAAAQVCLKHMRNAERKMEMTGLWGSLQCTVAAPETQSCFLPSKPFRQGICWKEVLLARLQYWFAKKTRMYVLMQHIWMPVDVVCSS